MISIIIINYNSTKYLNRNLLSIRNSILDDIKVEIILIDNNSKIKPNKSLIEKYKIIYYELNENSGYSKALNFAILKSNGKFILTLNPDAFVYNDCIKEIYNYYCNDDSLGIIGCKIININKSFQLASRRKFPYFKYILPYFFKLHKLGLVNYYNYCNINIDKIQEVDSVSGCCMFFNKKTYDQVNGFDERFFLYFEDTDFCLKVKKMSKKVIYYPLARVEHIKNGSRSYRNFFFVKYHFFKSFVKFYKKYSNDYSC